MTRTPSSDHRARRLSRKLLSTLPSDIEIPRYDMDGIECGIVHLGLGAFHRAQQALYTDDILGNDRRWGIVGVSLRDTAVRDLLTPQDCLYTVLERYGDNIQARVIGAIRAALHAPSDLEKVLGHIADPAVHVVTLTVTEKGYSQHPATGQLDLDDPNIRHDLANPDRPRSTLGILTAGIRRRSLRAPLTVICCDNMASNGETVRRLLLQYADRVDPAIARHIETAIAFPNSVVDRIVPAATAESLALAEEKLGIRDEAAIVCEPFKQWVIEDRFAGPRPPWEHAGVMLIDDTRPFQMLKLRLLNGTHSAIAYLGQLCGRETVADVMADERLSPFVRRLMLEEIRPTVLAPPRYDVVDYCNQLLRRFENPLLRHRTEQIAADGTQKIPVRWLPPLRESLAKNVELPRLERSLAAWLHYLIEGRAEDGRPLVIGDPGVPSLAQRLRAAGPDTDAVVRAALAHTAVFGDAPWPEAFATRIAAHIATLRAGGVAALVHGMG